jgi:hypothetical protein
VHAVQDDRHTGAPRRQTPDDPRLGLVGMHHVRRDRAQGRQSARRAARSAGRVDGTVQRGSASSRRSRPARGQHRGSTDAAMDQPDLIAARDLAAAGGEGVLLGPARQDGGHDMDHAQGGSGRLVGRRAISGHQRPGRRATRGRARAQRGLAGSAAGRTAPAPARLRVARVERSGHGAGAAGPPQPRPRRGSAAPSCSRSAPRARPAHPPGPARGAASVA